MSAKTGKMSTRVMMVPGIENNDRKAELVILKAYFITKLPAVKKVAVFLWALGFILIPLTPFFFNHIAPLEVVRTWIVLRWIEGLMVSIVLLWLLDRRKPIRINQLFAFSLTGFAISVIFSSLLGVDLVKSIVGNYYRGDGLITLFHFLGFSLIVFILWSDKCITLISRAIQIGVFLTCIFSLGRGWAGPFGNPVLLAGYLTVTLPFLLERITSVSGIEKVLSITLTGIAVLSLLLSGSSSAIWLGIIGVLAWVFIHIRFSLKTVLILIAASGILGLGVIWTVRYQNFIPEGRPRIFHRVLLGVLERPILGYGWANTDYAFEKVPWPIVYDHDIYVDRAHSTMLDVLAGTGVVGLIFYTALLIRIGRVLYNRAKIANEGGNAVRGEFYNAIFLSFLLYLLHSQTNVISQGEEMFLWFAAGVA